MVAPLVEIDRKEQGSRLFKLRILGGCKTLGPFGEAIGFKSEDASGSVSRVESGTRKLTEPKAKASAFYLAGRGDLIADPWVLYRFLLGFPGVTLRDCLSGGDLGSAGDDSAMGGYHTPEPHLRAVSGL